jgi:hypothetical protein
MSKEKLLAILDKQKLIGGMVRKQNIGQKSDPSFFPKIVYLRHI